MTVPAGLDPDLLRAFAYIAEEGSFTRAAERTGRTQSAVSMQVQRLEALLGQRVLTRGKGGSVSLTPHGRGRRRTGRPGVSGRGCSSGRSFMSGVSDTQHGKRAAITETNCIDRWNQ